jgi:hypothetical protein
LLPTGYYALAEQHAGQAIADVLTLHESAPPPPDLPPLPATTGGTAVAEAPPKVARQQVFHPSAARTRRRSLAVRHASGHRLIALLEIVSPANKDRRAELAEFADKIEYVLNRGVHVVIVDLIPPGRHDPQGIHGVIRQQLEQSDEPYDLPADRPLTLVSYVAGPSVQAWLEHIAVGDTLPELALFLNADRYVNVPLETTYQAAYRGMPAFWRNVLEGRPA